jgi:hypothetical protein
MAIEKEAKVATKHPDPQYFKKNFLFPPDIGL